MVEQRVRELERQMEDLTARVGLIDGEKTYWQAAPQPQVRRETAPPHRTVTLKRPAPPKTPAPPPAPPPAHPAIDRSFEDLLGGRVLAWVGGVAVLVALALLFALGISSGAIDETGRTLIGAGVAALLVGAGLYAHRRHGRTHASLALVGTGVAGLFMAGTVATVVYDLLPAALGVTGAAAIGAWATWLAIRWRAEVIGWLGLLGAVSAPLLSGASLNSETAGAATAFVFVAAACAAAVVVSQRWDRLALAVFTVATLQWWGFLTTAPSGLVIALTLLGFGAIGLATAIGREVRLQEPEPAASRLALVALNALAVGGIGHWAFGDAGLDGAATALLVVLAVVHAAVGAWGLRSGRIARPLALLTLTLGVLFGDLAFADLTSGVLRGVGFLAAGVGFAWLARHTARRATDDVLLGAGLSGHVAIALAQMLAVTPAEDLVAGDPGAAGIAGLAALAAACLGSGVLMREARPVWGDIANGLGLAAIFVLTLTALSGLALVAALCAEAIALGRYAQRDTHDSIPGPASLIALGLAATVGVVVSLDAAILPALGAVALVTATVGVIAYRHPAGELRNLLTVATGVCGLYLVSLAALELPLTGDADQGQLQLTAAWALVGVGALVVGVRNDLRGLRLAALGLLGVAAGKAFLFDLATLAPAQRIGSLLGLGLLLLGGAFAYQRLRPEAPADLRSVPSALR
ncbi:DUF2339 domain-containing protein [Svornostia abyssi]|uniref:DUF2339 domain-containing protein n=1 Tax=Svornostia abyssi TaxID=2898438 RepID=A0ABY5PB59_9ACTN|nr:DUF2339 domain-containing protein [Parviterribacteraceae bacterium J379]